MTSSSPHHLRPVRADGADATAVLDAFRSAPDMERQGDVTDLESATRYLAWLTADDRRAIALCDEDDRMLGIVGVSIDDLNRSGWVFYWLHASARGGGLMSRAAATVCDRALAPEKEGGWGLERLELGHRANNPASGGVARAAGFVVEGRERGKFLMDGERIDVLTYGRLRSDQAPYAAPLPWEHDGA